jgi:hypothetical protein
MGLVAELTLLAVMMMVLQTYTIQYRGSVQSDHGGEAWLGLTLQATELCGAKVQ